MSESVTSSPAPTRGFRLTLAQARALVWAQPSFEGKAPTRRMRRHVVYMLTETEARELAQACDFWLVNYDVDSTPTWPLRHVLAQTRTTVLDQMKNPLQRKP